LDCWPAFVDEAEFKRRTRGLGLDVIALVKTMPRDFVGDTLARQLIRSATSVGANYRAACRGRSTADVMSRLAIVEEESDETIYWLEMLRDSKSVPAPVVAPLIDEANQICAMTVASIRTLRARRNPKSPIQNPK
jgi:four helix bundle protein